MELMPKPTYSIVVPVFNRPDEVEELLASIVLQCLADYEVIIVDDGSEKTCRHIVDHYISAVPVRYYFKENEGPGLTRNFGAKHALGKWIIFLDSDCFLPENYLKSIEDYLEKNEVDVFGGPDVDHPSFSGIQYAISFSMTSFLTTGGIRGGKKSMEKFKPRSFNMGMRKEVFETVGGFGKLRFGEDIDLSLRLFQGGFQTRLIGQAYVYHKRRANFRQFYKQIFNSGIARIVLSRLHPGTLNVVHLFPLLFILGNVALLILSIFFPFFLNLFFLYPTLLIINAFFRFGKVKITLLSVIASYVQLVAYGLGFLRAFWTDKILRRPIRYAYLDSYYD